jgi:hypothetical protein
MTSSADSFGTTESQLRALVSRGFRFLHPRASCGNVLAVVGVRAHDSVVDVMWLHGESDARAVRMPGDERDVLEPTRILWESRGPAGTVLAELLRLPDPAQPAPDHPAGNTGRARGGCWVPTHPGTTRWLAAAG